MGFGNVELAALGWVASAGFPFVFLLKASRNGLTVGGSWFGLIFKASFPRLGRVVASHTMHSVGDGTGEPNWQFRAVPLGWVSLDHGWKFGGW